MSYLGVDVGSRRVGLAVSRSGIVAEPVGSFSYEDRDAVIDSIAREVSEYQATTVVVGLPYRRDGSLGEHGQAIRILVETLKERLPDIAVATVDEALTSKEAERLGGRLADHDALAAVLILEQYLAANPPAA